MHRARCTVLLTCLALLWFQQAGAQVLLHTLASPNEHIDGWFGSRVSGAGDVNNDGYDDVVVGASKDSPGGSPEGAGRAYIFSGADWNVLLTLFSPNEEEQGRFGGSVSGAGDVNNDGHADLIAGASGESPGSSPEHAGRAHIFSGADWSVLRTLVSPNEEEEGYFGSRVSGAGDVNNDGHDDVIVGAAWENPGTSPQQAGRAYVFSGADGSLLYSLSSPNEEMYGLFGISVSGAGDVNNDGHTDVIVGAVNESPGASPDYAGRAYVFSGVDGSVLHTLSSPNQDEYGGFGLCVSGLGDVDNDGHADVTVGASYESPGASPEGAGRAYVFSGVDGSLLHALSSPNEELYGNFGVSVSGLGDVDDDGHVDVVAGAPFESPGTSPDYAGRVYVFSGVDGRILYALASPYEEEWGRFGNSVSRAGDVNNDGYHDLIVGAPFENPGSSPNDAGRAYVFALQLVPVELTSFEAACQPNERVVVLQWSTASESNCLGFYVERTSANGGPYARLNTEVIPGAGTSNVPHSYRYVDADITPGTRYYRLAQVDTDATMYYHTPVTVTVANAMLEEMCLISAQPNPFAQSVTITYTVPSTIAVHVAVYDVQGRLVRILVQGEQEPGTYHAMWEAKDDFGRIVAPGQYFAQLSGAGYVVTTSLVLVR